MEKITGRARVDRRTKNLIPRLRAGDIAILDHRDLDALSAAGLIEKKPGAVINASPSISGRYPNRGPELLVAANIPLLDVHDPAIMVEVSEGQQVSVSDEGLHAGDRIFTGVWLTDEFVKSALEDARNYLGVEIEAFARNTLEYMERERHLVVDAPDVPELKTPIANRHAVVVVRGDGFKRDLQAILPYVRDVRPVLIAVDGAADALLEQGLKPHLIVGDMDSVSDEALRCGAEIVVHCYARAGSGDARPLPAGDANPGAAGIHAAGRDGIGGSYSARSNVSAVAVADPPAPVTAVECLDDPTMVAPGLKRLHALGLEGKVFPVAGTSEDMAMLIAYEKGAEVIVAVGAHYGLIDFLDKGRAGMASTFLVRLRVASRLVDARGVGALYNRHEGYGWVWGMVAAALAPLLAIASLSPGARIWCQFAWTLFLHWLQQHGIG